MSYNTDTKIMDRLREHLEYALNIYDNKDWFVIALQGSQNYGMSDAESDIDSKLLLIPSLDDLVLNKKPISHTLIMPDNEEHVDCKDTRLYFQTFRKANINFVEILFTDYFIVNECYEDLWFELKAHAEELARMNPYAAVKCMLGMSSEKKHALCHEYPSRMPWIEKFGYDPKQLAHLERIEYFTRHYIYGYDYADCIYPRDEKFREELLLCKRNGMARTKEQAEEFAEKLFENIHFMVDEITGKVPQEKRTFCESTTYKNENDPEMDTLLNDVLYELMIRSLKMALKEK